MPRVERISFSTPPELMKQFDQSLSAMGYEDRSKALQMAIRNFISEYAWKAEKGKCGVGAVLMTYDHETHGIQEELTHAQHRYRDVVSSTMHIHLDESLCLEIISVKGKLERIQTMAKELMRTKGVSQLKLSTISL
ncbi:MAG TPA: nickel-responsive transcriptional regulator NikR [Candidatus Acidoferrales bacterium]|nr:nickel-responsive transcriptional regulator NikR [Candidatus Acidoferrales bacterium]